MKRRIIVSAVMLDEIPVIFKNDSQAERYINLKIK